MVMWSGCLVIGFLTGFIIGYLLMANVREEGHVQLGPLVYSMIFEMLPLRDGPNLSVPLLILRQIERSGDG